MLYLWEKNHQAGKYRGAAHSICNLKLNVPNNGSSYDYYLSLKNQQTSLRGNFFLAKNTEKYKRFAVLIEKEVTKIDKDGNERVIIVSFKIKFIDSARLVAISLSNLVHNLAERIHKIKYKDCDCFLEYESINDKGVYIRYVGEEMKGFINFSKNISQPIRPQG